MAKPRKSSLRNKKKNTSKSSRGASKSSKSKSSNLTATTSSESPVSDTSPFRGFDTASSTPTFQRPLENDKDLLFDRLVDPDYKSAFWQKPVRTYYNKKKEQEPEPRLLEFEDCKNREVILHWLHDNRNAFDRLTQTQRECASEDDEVTFDMPSVSQANARLKQPNSRRQTRQSSRKLRARSLDIKIKKNLGDGRSKRHSLAGDTPSMENYRIEEVVTDEETPGPAEKIIVDLMEDEYLDSLEKEMMQEKTGWNRIKDINQTISCPKRKPKQLKITLQGVQPRKVETKVANRAYDLDEVEHYFQEKMAKLMNDGKEEMSFENEGTADGMEDVLVQSAIDAGRVFLNLIKNIAQRQTNILTDIQPVISELETVFISLNKSITKLESHGGKLQTDANVANAHTQTEDLSYCQNCANNNIIIRSNKPPDLTLNDASVQCSQQKRSDTSVQTEMPQLTAIHVQTEMPQLTAVQVQTEASFCDKKINVEIQTDSLDNNVANSRSAIHSDTPAQNCDLNETLDDFCFETEDAFKQLETSKIIGDEAEKQKVETKENEVESCFIEVKNEASASKGVKRKSPVEDSYNSVNKRPCNRFINEDLSVDFESCAEAGDSKIQDVHTKEKDVQFSEDSDDLSVYDEYLAQVMKKYDSDAESQLEPSPKKTRTQEDLEQLEDVIRNATKPVRPANQDERQGSCSSRESDVIFVSTEGKIENDLDYFKTSKTPKTSRKSLFKSERNRKDDSTKFSENIFFSDNDETIAEIKEEKTITQENVDEVINEINRNSAISDDVDEEVQKILAPKINILQNIIVKPGADDLEFLTPVGTSQDPDIIEATPQKCYQNRSEQRRDSKLDITLPPPKEFQDTEEPNEIIDEEDIANVSAAEEPKKFINEEKTTPRRPLASLNKITSTPITQKNFSESLSLSPISLEKNRALGPIELALRQKFTPLTITTKKQASQKRSQSTQNQKSILNYVTSSPELSQSSTGKSKPCIACTRISRAEIMGLTSMTNKKLATYSSCFSPKVSHMIVSVDKENRIKNYTIKSVSAVAAGIWVLNYGWVRECLAKNCIVPEEPYEVLDIEGSSGPKTSRLQRLTNPLLKGYKIHAAPPFGATTKQDVENIVRMLGGKVAHVLEEMMDRDNCICIIIAEAKSTQDCDSDKFETWLEVFGVITVDLEWLSRSVSRYSLQPLRPFTLCSEDTIESLGYPLHLLENVSVSYFQSTSSVPS